MNKSKYFTFLLVTLLFFVSLSSVSAKEIKIRQNLIRANTLLRQGDGWSAKILIISTTKGLTPAQSGLAKKLNRVVVLIQREKELPARVRLVSIIKSL